VDDLWCRNSSLIDETAPSSPSALRTWLKVDSFNNPFSWLSLQGLSASDEPHHRAFCQALAKLGLGGEARSPRASRVALDWSSVYPISADGLAFSAVLANSLPELEVVRCAAADATAEGIIRDTGISPLLVGAPVVETSSTDSLERHDCRPSWGWGRRRGLNGPGGPSSRPASGRRQRSQGSGS
jgi:hypothetical protein